MGERIFILLLFLLCGYNLSMAQSDSLPFLKGAVQLYNYSSGGIKKTREVIKKHLDRSDSLYISPNRYYFTLMGQYSNGYEYYRFSSADGNQSFSLAPDNFNKMGLYVGWEWLFVGWMFDIDDNNDKTDLNFSFYTSRLGVDLYYRKTGKNFIVKRMNGFFAEDGSSLSLEGSHFNGLSVKQIGFNLYYIFNSRHFSYPAAYSQSTNQRISCGSWIAGVNISKQSFDMDVSQWNKSVQDAMSPSIKFTDIDYTDYSVNVGYSYNWVFLKNCLANLSITPAVGYKYSSSVEAENNSFFEKINFDLISRAAIVYNNSHYYIGSSFVSHSYSYRRSGFSVISSFGVLCVYVGMNIFPKKR